MRNRRGNVAGFIVPYKCYEVVRRESLDRNKMRVKKGHLRPSPNEEAQLIKEETEKRRKLRLKQVREQSKENAAKIRQSVKHEKHKQLMKLATEIKSQLEEEKAERVRHLEQQYDNSLRNIGLGHRDASLQPDWSEERALVMAAEKRQAELRGTEAMVKLREETSRKMMEAQRINMARKQALEVERARASDIAAMPPPPPDPVSKIDLKRKPVKVTDMNTYSTSHYHLMNDHVVDRADTPEQTNACDAADLEQERIKERALELKQLRQDQLERARVRHNIALEKELLKHDYNNILHDLSDLQRADRERRLRIVHNIPKQVFEPPNIRMEDREDKQKQMEQEFEDMYMAGTDYMGDISMALGPQPHPEAPSGTASLDITTTSIGTPLQEPTLPAVPPVLRDMTNMPKPKSPAKKPEKVLRNLMDRIKSQREEWITSHSMMEVGEGEPQRIPDSIPRETDQQGMGAFRLLVPDEETPFTHKVLSPPEKLPRVTSPVEPTALQQGGRPPVPRPRQTHTMVPPPVQAPIQQPVPPPGPVLGAQGSAPMPQGPVVDGRPQEVQQCELEEIIKQQQLILEQKRQLELKLQQLTYQHQNLQVANKLSEQQQQSVIQHVPVSSLPQSQAPPGQQMVNSLSSSTTSNQPMNSIPPTHTTSSVPMTTAYQGQAYIPTPAYQPVSAALTTAQLLPPTGSTLPTTGLPNGFGPNTSAQGYQVQGQPMVAMTTPASTAVPAPVSTPSFVGAVPADGHTEQMRRVREYQQYLLARHEQSKRVLAETKAEIQRRRDNLMQKYPKLDLTRLEDLGAKYLDNQPGEEIMPQQVSMAAPAPVVGQGQVAASAAEVQGQGQSVPVTSLLASLASHPYYAQTLSQALSAAPPAVSETLVNGVVGALQTNISQPDIDFDTNLRKNKFDTIRKSLPFDTDESFQSPAVRVYDAYTSKQLDITTGTETSEVDTSTSTERGSPKLKAPTKFEPLQEEISEGDTSSPDSVLSDQADSLTTRQEELLHQLADIQRQKEEIMQRHASGQERVQQKQDQLKAKLATVSTADQQAQLRDTFRRVVEEKQTEAPQPSTSGTTVYPGDTSTSEDDSPLGARRQNLSTILEVETPASTRPSEGPQDRLSLGSTDSGASYLSSRRSLEGQLRAEPIPEEGRLDGIATQMQKQEAETVAAYSGSNIQNILERAKRFETEVLEKLRQQTNAVLFDQGFDDSLEFNVSQRPVVVTSVSSGESVELDVVRRQAAAPPLSSGSITPDDSLSTGPLNDSDITRSYDLQSTNGSLQIPKSRDPHSANGSFQSTRSWANELASFKIPPAQQTDLAFKVMKPDLTPDSEGKKTKEESMFAGDVNRFKVYSTINKSDSSSDESLEGKPVGNERTLDAGDMLQHLRKIQEDIRTGEQTRKILEQDLADRQAQSRQDNFKVYDSGKYDYVQLKDKTPSHIDQDLSQYPVTPDLSLNHDVHASKDRQPSPAAMPILSGTSSVQRELPVRKSPIGDLIRSGSPAGFGESKQELTTTEYSFTMADGKHRSTSTPGDDRSKSTVEKSSRISELPSEISAEGAGRERNVPSSSLPQDEFQTPKPHVARTEARGKVERMAEPKAAAGAASNDISTYTISSESNSNGGLKSVFSTEDQFKTLSPDSQQQFDTLTSDLTTGSISSADESSLKFKKLTAVKPTAGIKTYSVTIDGDLVSEHSDSDKSAKIGKKSKYLEDLSTYSVSSIDESTQGVGEDSKSLSLINKDSLKIDQFSGLSKISVPDISDVSEHSEESQPKSSSLTNVTSDPSLNSMTGVSSLSQYTFQTEDQTGVPNLTQYTLKSEDTTGAPDLSQYSLKSADITRKSEDKSLNASGGEESSNFLQKKFASLDNLITESKSLIAKHKVLVDKNKQMEDAPKEPSAEESTVKPAREVTPGVQTITAQESNVKKFKEWYKSTPGAVSGTESDSSKLSSFTTSTVSSSVNKGNVTDTFDENSLEYLVEHSAGITDEPMPDLTTMTMGSELSISEAFNKTDLSDSGDSLKSFEKHEMSTVDSESLSNSRTDESWNARQSEQSQSDSVQDLIESRKQHFLAESERRANAAKERALSAHQKKDSGDIIFRAVPVSVVAEPTLSMSTKVSGTQRGRSPVRGDTKSEQSVKDKKKSFEEKEAEIKASSSPLTPALQPRGSRQADAGSRPKETGARAKDTGDKPRPVTTADKKKMGALTGEIKSFGGSAGLAAKQAYAKKVPPAVKPKPVRSKSTDSGAPPPLPATAPPQLQSGTTAAPPTITGQPQATSSLSKTLSSWKKSRSLSAPAPAIAETAPPKNSIKVLPEEAPVPLTEEEREQRVTADNVIYQRHMRAYNPRLFRLERQLDTDEPAPTKKPSQESPRSRSLDRRDTRKKPSDGVKKKTKKK